MTRTHECPAPGCSVLVDFKTFACKTHWFTIPAPLRQELWREFRRNFEARANCLRALGVPEESIAEENAGVA